MVTVVVAADMVGADEILKEGVVEAPEAVVRITEVIVAVGVVLVIVDPGVRTGMEVAACVPVEVAGVDVEAGVVGLAAGTTVL